MYNIGMVAVEYSKKTASAVWSSVSAAVLIVIGFVAIFLSFAPRFSNTAVETNPFIGVVHADAPAVAGDSASSGGDGSGGGDSGCDGGDSCN